MNAGKTDQEIPFIYSIVRTLGENHLQAGYTLTMNLRFPGGPVCIQGFFDPSGMREAQTLEYAMQKGYVDKDMKGWARDPYDPAFKKGVLTNFSELPGFDSAFPEHPPVPVPGTCRPCDDGKLKRKVFYLALSSRFTKFVTRSALVSGYGTPAFFPASKQRIIQIMLRARFRMGCSPSSS